MSYAQIVSNGISSDRACELDNDKKEMRYGPQANLNSLSKKFCCSYERKKEMKG